MRSLLLLCLFAFIVPSAAASEGVQLFPSEFVLDSSESRQRLLLQEFDGAEIGGQLRDEIQWASSNPDVAAVINGMVRPVGNGKATITATTAGRTATAKVTVGKLDEPLEFTFSEHLVPLLAKQGCNTGACHGAVAGKGGFRLSLRGYDPQSDYFNIVKQDRGRRIELADPGRSLLLAKPSGGIAHKGGLRFEPGSLDYKIIAQWITAGAKPPSDHDPRVEALEILPPRSSQKVGDQQQFVVMARYDNGDRRDVTRWVIWSSSNEAVGRVDEENGEATVVGPGEGAIVAWFDSHITLARLTVPFVQSKELSEQPIDRREPRNFIDEHVDRHLARLNLPASGNCSDGEFIRRAYVDTIGCLPTAEEVTQFLEDPAPDKRDRLIDALLARPEYVDYWTYKWSDILMLNGRLLRPQAIQAYYKWIHGHVEQNTPWDEFVSEILTATGSSHENGATNFYALHQTPEEMVENSSQAFLGLSIGCAKCHNHPLEKWTNDQYYAAANMFSRVKAKGWGGEPRNGNGLRTLYTASSGELVQPRTGKPQQPAPLDGEPIAFDDPGDRRGPFAQAITSPENPYFARAIANRVWANYYGVGLIESVDDLRTSNPASNEELLGAAAQFVVDSKFDLKPLMREILRSNAYQRTSRPLPGNKTEERFYSRYYPRRMMAEVLHDAIVKVTDVPTKFDFVEFDGADRQKTDFYPLGTRAIELYDSAVENYFLRSFGRNPRGIVCECERSSQPTMVQALHISNGNTINEKLKAPDSRVMKLLADRKEGLCDDALLDRIFLTSLARYPSDQERTQLAGLLPAPGAEEERIVLEDIFWGVMSSREFLFNH